MKITGLLLAVVVVVLVACAARESAGLPWEEAQRLLFNQQIRGAANGAAMSKRELDIPMCPDHPQAIPQAFINRRVSSLLPLLLLSSLWKKKKKKRMHSKLFMCVSCRVVLRVSCHVETLS